jgi:protein-L-isoaspartate O-methyltransferase
MRKFLFFAIFAALAACPFLIPVMQAQESPDKLAPYYPTPMKVVDKMLELGELKAGETMFDLGSGDGRIVIRAAEKYKAKSIGVEYDASLAKQSQDRIKTLGLSNLASIIQGDLLQQNYESADLITVYLLPVGNNLVTPILEKQLKKGARIVAHDFQFTAWRTTRIIDIADDGEGRSHRLYLYTR